MTASVMDPMTLTSSKLSGACPAPATWDLLANADMRVYLQELIAHESSCALENCGFCESARCVYDLVRSLIFSEVEYPDVKIAAHRPMAAVVDWIAPAEACSVSRAA